MQLSSIEEETRSRLLPYDGDLTCRCQVNATNHTSKGLIAKTKALCLACALFMTLFLFAKVFLQNAFIRDEMRPMGSPEDAKQLAIRLHPEEHAMRRATTLAFDWNVTKVMRAPDGVEKQVYLVNGLLPGPTIEARSGDRIIVRVSNGLISEDFSIHWHGLRMKGFNRMDGATGFTQCSIPPGSSFVYDFRIGNDEHGTFWWHSQDQHGMRSDGLFGGFIVHPPASRVAPRDDALLLIGDWFHRRQTDILTWYADQASLGNEPVPDSLIINGHGRFDCSSAVPARPIKCVEKHYHDIKPLFSCKPTSGSSQLRLINTGSVTGFSVAIDGARLRPVSVDGACSVSSPYVKAIGVIHPGERVDVEIVWEEEPRTPYRLNVILDSDRLALESLTASLRHLPELPAKANISISFYIKTQRLSVQGNRPLGFINHTSWQPQAPPLLALGRTAWNTNQLVPFIDYSSESTTIDLIINNLDDGAHAMHLHGYSFYVLATSKAIGRQGWGSYTPDTSLSLNLLNPMLKDTVSVPRRGFVILRLLADNPGVWMLHCHMLVHMGTGMVAGLHVGNHDDHQHVQAIEPSAAQLCVSETAA